MNTFVYDSAIRDAAASLVTSYSVDVAPDGDETVVVRYPYVVRALLSLPPGEHLSASEYDIWQVWEAMKALDDATTPEAATACLVLADVLDAQLAVASFERLTNTAIMHIWETWDAEAAE